MWHLKTNSPLIKLKALVCPLLNVLILTLVLPLLNRAFLLKCGTFLTWHLKTFLLKIQPNALLHPVSVFLVLIMALPLPTPALLMRYCTSQMRHPESFIEIRTLSTPTITINFAHCFPSTPIVNNDFLTKTYHFSNVAPEIFLSRTEPISLPCLLFYELHVTLVLPSVTQALLLRYGTSPIVGVCGT